MTGGVAGEHQRGCGRWEETDLRGRGVFETLVAVADCPVHRDTERARRVDHTGTYVQHPFPLLFFQGTPPTTSSLLLSLLSLSFGTKHVYTF